MDDYDDIQLCEWCESADSTGLFELDGSEMGLCADCAEDNFAERLY
ncbi:hypothetical protein [Streptomyces sp. NPDC047990]